MITPTAIIRTNRRSLSLTISKNGELIVRAPKRLSMEYIYSFIKQKEKWILNKQNNIKNSNVQNYNFINGSEYLFCGKVYRKIEINKLKDIEIADDNIFFPANLDSYQTKIIAVKWYTNLTKEILKNRVEYFANIMQVDFSAIKIDNSKTRWGSCNQNGVIKFNLRLSMLPHKVIDYIIIHELSHLIEFNHSKNFYRIIESVMVDYKKYKQMLKDYNFVLQLLR